jgi:hypothetical protein
LIRVRERASSEMPSSASPPSAAANGLAGSRSALTELRACRQFAASKETKDPSVRAIRDIIMRAGGAVAGFRGGAAVGPAPEAAADAVAVSVLLGPTGLQKVIADRNPSSTALGIGCVWGAGAGAAT